MNTYEDTKIQSFTRFGTWKTSHRLALDIYQITDGLPPKEQSGIDHEAFQNLAERTVKVHKLISGLIKLDQTKQEPT